MKTLDCAGTCSWYKSARVHGHSCSSMSFSSSEDAEAAGPGIVIGFNVIIADFADGQVRGLGTLHIH